ncbi:MAG: acylneuraminate cytidylyltransferase family protein, partial [Patescibacteria group bacterium]
MSSDKKILGIITARGGSKRIPKKSIVPVLGKPTMAYVCDAFKKSRLVNRFIVDTDDEEMADVGRRNGAEVAYMRPKELAQDGTA